MSNYFPWVDWFISQKENKCFCKIDTAFMNDHFNLYGLRAKLSNFREAIHTIRSEFDPNEEEEDHSEAIKLYGLLHARYIITVEGMAKMYKKYSAGDFQRCPRVLCNGTECLPYGCSEIENEGTLKFYCPNCGDVYEPERSIYRNIDGAYFGPSWVHIFTQQYSDITPPTDPVKYVPRVFGFKVRQQEDSDNEEI